MRHFLKAGLLLAPCIAVGGPIPFEPTSTDSRVMLEVDYWGRARTLFDVDFSHGKLWVDPALMGPDRAPDDSMLGRYTWSLDCELGCPLPPEAQSFVASDRVSPGAPSSTGDLVSILDGAPGGRDLFHIQDAETWPGKNFLFNLSVSGPLDFIHGEGLMQSFDIDLAKDDAVGSGSISGLLRAGAVWNYFTITLDRIRVRPRVCKF